MDVREVRTFEIDAIRAFEKVPINLGHNGPQVSEGLLFSSRGFRQKQLPLFCLGNPFDATAKVSRICPGISLICPRYII